MADEDEVMKLVDSTEGSLLVRDDEEVDSELEDDTLSVEDEDGINSELEVVLCVDVLVVDESDLK